MIRKEEEEKENKDSNDEESLHSVSRHTRRKIELKTFSQSCFFFVKRAKDKT